MKANNIKPIKSMYTFRDNWVGDIYQYPTLREAKKEAKHYTWGFSINIYHNGEIVAIVPPRENPFP